VVPEIPQQYRMTLPMDPGAMATIPPRPILEKAKVSQKSQLPNMVAYGANTHNGLVRSYNEDRISIVLDLKKPGIQPASS